MDSLGYCFHWERHFSWPCIYSFSSCILQFCNSKTKLQFFCWEKMLRDRQFSRGHLVLHFPVTQARNCFLPVKWGWEWNASISMHCCWDKWQLSEGFWVSNSFEKSKETVCTLYLTYIKPRHWSHSAHIEFFLYSPDKQIAFFSKRKMGFWSRIWRGESLAYFADKMFAKYMHLSPFPSFLNSCPTPITSSAFNPYMTGGFQWKYYFVSATHMQCFEKFDE